MRKGVNDKMARVKRGTDRPEAKRRKCMNSVLGKKRKRSEGKEKEYKFVTWKIIKKRKVGDGGVNKEGVVDVCGQVEEWVVIDPEPPPP